MIYIFIVDISAMLLLGISGSNTLLIFGLYTPILNSIKEIITLNFIYLPNLTVFMCGLVIGITITTKFIKHILKNYR